MKAKELEKFRGGGGLGWGEWREITMKRYIEKLQMDRLYP